MLQRPRSAAVLESAMAAASATVASFMPCPFKLYFVRNVGGIDRLQRTFSSRLFNLARLAGSFLLRFTGIEPIITRKTARQKNRRASLSVLACPGAQPQTSD